MTKRMRELQTEITNKAKKAQELVDCENKDIAKATALLDEVDELQKEYDMLARIDEVNKTAVPDTPVIKKDMKKEKVSGFELLSKIASGKILNATEKETLISGTEATNGENYLIPEDVKLEINELRKSYISAKDIVTVIPTSSLTGSENFESKAPTGLITFNDGDDVPAAVLPEFVKKIFTIKWYGSLIPISNILIGAEKAGLLSYLNRWFLKNAVITENKAIFEALKKGFSSGVPKELKDWKELKKSINKDLDPSCLINGMIVTNQSGFNFLDEAEDANGRPILQPDPSNSTIPMFQSLPIIVFSDTLFPNIDDTHFPVIYGDTKAGCKFIDYQSLQFAYSEHYGFAKNQNYLRIIEGFDIMSADTSAYIYGSLGAGAE